jgi:hypothetical protein
MRISLSSLVLASAFCASTALAATHARVDVPFSFTAKGQTYPAGSYDVVLDGSRSFVTLASRVELGKQILWIVNPAEPAFMPAVVKFDQVGTEHALRSIQLDDKITPNLDRHPNAGVSATTSIGGQ